MKSKVVFSTFSTIITIASYAVVISMAVAAYPGTAFVGVCIIAAVISGLGLWFAPLSLSTDSNGVNINRLIKTKTVPYSDIDSVALFKPTMAAKRICGSGGFFGYWGVFHESDTGRYTAFYGRASDCFMLTLKSGEKYVLGCKGPQDMVNEIKGHLYVGKQSCNFAD